MRCCYTTQRGALSVQNRQNLMKRNLHTKPHSRTNPLQLTADRSFLKGVPNSTFFFSRKKKYIYAKLDRKLLTSYLCICSFSVSCHMVKDGIFSKLTELMSFKLDIGQRSLCARDSLKIPNLNR